MTDIQTIPQDVAAAMGDALHGDDTTYLRRRQGVVAAVYGGYPVTVDVTLGGVTLPGIRVLSGYAPVAGDAVMVDLNGPDAMVVGSTAGTSLGAGGPVTLGRIGNVGVASTTSVVASALVLTVTVPAARTIRATAKLHMGSTVAGDRVVLQVREGATIVNASYLVMGLANNGEDLLVTAVFTPTAGQHTYTVWYGRDLGSGTVTPFNTPGVDEDYFLIEDITGNPAPYNPASVPVGQLGYAVSVTDQTGIPATTDTAITGLTTTVTVPAGRVLRVTLEAMAKNNTADITAEFNMLMDGGRIQTDDQQIRIANQTQKVFSTAIVSPAAGSHTFVGRVFFSAGTGVVAANAIYPAYIMVEDITPTPASGTGAPSSVLARSSPITTNTAVGAETTIGSSLVVTVPDGRVLKLNFNCQVNNDTTPGQVVTRFKEGATELGRASVDDMLNAGSALVDGSIIVTPTAGTHTYSLTGTKLGGGVCSYIQDSSVHNSFWIEDITGAMWSGAQVTAGMVASEAWVPYTPALSNITLGNGTVSGRWFRLGRLIYAQGIINFGSTSSVTARPGLGVPVPKFSGVDYIGMGYGLDGGLQEYSFGIHWASDSIVEWLYYSAPNGVVNTTIPISGTAWGNGDNLRFMVVYEAAS